MNIDKQALAYAAKLVGYRALTEKQLSDKMIGKGYDSESIAIALVKLKEMGGINDESYAQMYIRSLKARGYGRSRISQKLREKGIDREISEIALEDFSPDYQKMQKYISSKIKTENPDRSTIKKVSDGLLRKGFSWQEVKKALNQYLDDEDNYEL